MPQIWKAPKYVNCMYVEATPWGSSSGDLRVFCPDLMPMVSMGKPKITPVPLQRTIFINSSDCAISIPTRIETQNYITAQAVVGEFKQPNYDFGTTIQVESLDDFMQRCRVTLNVDNSTNHY